MTTPATDNSPIHRVETDTPLTDVMNGSSRWEIRLHEHGFIALVDAMPRLVPQGQTADFAIVQAARVSYGAGTKKVSEDRGLIRYLMRHRHTTPLEMVEFKFHVAMPIFIARQWIRHRTACLAEGTDIHFDLPGGIKRRGNQLYKLPIEEIARRFEPTRNSQRPDKQRNPHFRRDRIRSMRLRQINEDDLRIGHTRIVSVYRNGTKPVFRMTLADGKHIESTADHRFLFADGWHTLKEATGLHLSGSRAVWNADDSYLYVNGTTELVWAKHQEAAWLNEQYNVLNRKIADIAEECGVSYHTVRKWLRLHHLQHRTGGRTHPAWNEGKTYRLGSRKPSAAWLEGNRKSRSGPASNFWKGGISTEREGIARWTTQVAHKVHRINGWTCQLCRTRAGELHCHHVVPVWADRTLAREQSNLTTLCGHCHHKVQGRELEYVEQLGGPPVRTEWRKRPRVPWNKLEVAKLVRLETIEYVGEKPTYDLEVEGPHHNFIANGIVTHNSVNEYSARYSIVQDRFYRPSVENIRRQSAANRQGGTEPVDVGTAEEFLSFLQSTEDHYAEYQQLLDKGVTRELARIGLPVSAYTEWYWKCDLHNIFHFLSLRMDEHAQQEIREYAEAMFALIKPIVPIAAEAFEQYVLHGVHLTQLEIEALRTGQPLASDNKREQAEWEGKKGRMGIESQKSKVKSQNTEDHANE
jgi:thymidylate synthase (FAD)